MSMFDASQLPDDVLALLHESDQAARANRWAKLRETFPKDLPLHVRMALLEAWLDESTDSEGEVVVSLLQGGEPPPTLVWLIPDYQTALECLSSLRAEAPDKARTLVRVALRLVQPAAAFFYTGARTSGWMGAIKKGTEQRKVTFGVDIQRAADEFHIYVPINLRIQRVEAMHLPWERFGLQPPAGASASGTESGSKSVEAGTAGSVPEVAPGAPGSPSPLPAETKKPKRRRAKPFVFYASQMQGPSMAEVFEMAKLPYVYEVADKLWERTNWMDLFSACLSADVSEDEVLDEVPCYSDALYKITILDRERFAEELRAAIMNVVSD